MRIVALLMMLVSTTVLANIPVGRYKVDKIQCKTGKELKLGGRFMVYTILLDVEETSWIMTAKAKSGSWAPFKLDCTQINKGKFTYTAEGKLEGDLPNESVACNNPAWTRILKSKLFGVEEFGEFTYKVSGNKLEIYNPNTITKYSCDSAGDYPVYYYTKQ
ncbi:MAG: hypothetical protein CME65_16010 [Halobacteriovoraceae bacterium]|nr:hypothetical protein [Halobacteriovoraceae bacterium]|tara:strand:+ start:4345 stop:4827 length:483 start_codon:yes stop_codon:yes gene_type:complete